MGGNQTHNNFSGHMIDWWLITSSPVASISCIWRKTVVIGTDDICRCKSNHTELSS